MTGLIWFLFGLTVGLLAAFFAHSYVLDAKKPTGLPIETALSEIEQTIAATPSPELWELYQKLLAKHKAASK
jgi:hypothetical protein